MPDIEFSTKGAEKVVAAHDQVGKAAVRNYQLTAKEAKSLGTLEQKIIRDTETARERYNRLLDQSRKALAGNRNEVDLLQRREQQLAAQFVKTATEGEKAAIKHKVAIGKATAEENKLHDAIVKTEAATKGIGTGLSDAFSAARIGGALAGIVSLQKAAELVTAEFRAQQEMIDKRNAVQTTVSESRNILLRNMVGVDPSEVAKMQGQATSIAKDTGVSEVAINNALAAAISATGGKNDFAAALVRKAAQFMTDKPSDIGQFAGSLGDFSRMMGSTDPNVSLGFLAKVGALSRITNPAMLAQNAPRGLIGATTFGATPRTAGALYAALTSGSGDFTGAQSATAEVALAEQLNKFDFGAEDRAKKTADLKEKFDQKQKRIGEIQQQLADNDQDESDRDKKHREGIAKRLNTATISLARAEEDQRGAKGQFAQRNAARRVADAQASVAHLQQQLAEADPNRRKERLFRSLQQAQAEAGQAGGELQAATQGDAAAQSQLDKFKKMDTLGKIRFLQANPALAKQFLDSASFEKTSLGPIMKLFDPNSDVARDFDNALKSIPDNAGLAKLGQSASTITQRLNPLDSVARRKRALRVATERMQTRHASEFLDTEELQDLHDQAMESGQTNLGANLDEMIGRIKGGGKVRASDAIKLLKKKEYQLEHPTESTGDVTEGFHSPYSERPRQPTQEEKEQTRILKDMLKQLTDTAASMKRISMKESGMLVE